MRRFVSAEIKVRLEDLHQYSQNQLAGTVLERQIIQNVLIFQVVFIMEIMQQFNCFRVQELYKYDVSTVLLA